MRRNRRRTAPASHLRAFSSSHIGDRASDGPRFYVGAAVEQRYLCTSVWISCLFLGARGRGSVTPASFVIYAVGRDGCGAVIYRQCFSNSIRSNSRSAAQDNFGSLGAYAGMRGIARTRMTSANVKLAHEYLRAVESMGPSENVSRFYSADIEFREFPNRIVPMGAGAGAGVRICKQRMGWRKSYEFAASRRSSHRRERR
jgi:hypothetical protein